MRVLVDFTQIPLSRTGVGIYADNLILNLIPLLRSEDVLLLMAQSDDAVIREAVKGHSNVHLVTIPSRIFRNRLLLFGFEQIILPILALCLRADLIHSLHYTHPILAFSRRIVTIHDLTFFLFPELHTRSRRMIMRFFIRRAMKYAEALIFVSKSTQNDAEQMLPAGRNLKFVVPLGVSFPPASSSETSPNWLPVGLRKVPYLLFVGTLEPRKNIVRIVHAFERVAGENADLQLVLAGKLGWHTDEIIAAIDNSPLRSRIHHLGFVSEAEKATLLCNCAALVYPSLYEGFGLPILEGMAAGAPVITSNISSMPEIAGRAALLVDPVDVDAIATAIRVLLGNHKQAQIFTGYGKETASQFSWINTAISTYKSYRALISRE
jgi:glycosyltransferase involved in cell wall biosynthesis